MLLTSSASIPAASTAIVTKNSATGGCNFLPSFRSTGSYLSYRPNVFPLLTDIQQPQYTISQLSRGLRYGNPLTSPSASTNRCFNSVWASVAEASKKAMTIRYSLLPYMYTLFYLSHTTGSTVMRALSWEYPSDPTLAAVDNQFLLGPSLMIVPALGQGMTEVKGVFPGVAQGEVWYDWYSQEAMSAKPGQNVTVPAPLGHIPVFVRGGSVLPQQEALYTTSECRNSSWSLLVALDANDAASGQLYVDDGESIMPNATLYVDLTASNGSLYASARGLYQDSNALANVTIMGVSSKPNSVTLNGDDIGNVAYNSSSKVLKLTELTSTPAWAEDWVLTWA
jgi:alpha-glucosidase